MSDEMKLITGPARPDNSRCFATFGLLIFFMLSSAGATEPQATMPLEHASLFRNHCFDCHDASNSEAGINLEELSYVVSESVENAERWQKILNVINSGEMPPRDTQPLEDSQKAAFLESLTKQMVIARKVLGDSGGVIALRRLNRREYANTIESLLGVRPDISSLPDDQSGAGFDTQGASLFFSSDQLEGYLAAAADALRLCLYPPASVPVKTRRVEPEESQTMHYQQYLDTLIDKHARATAWKAQSEKPPSAFGIQDEYQAKKDLQQYENWGPQLEEYLAREETKTGVTLILTIKAGGPTRVKLPMIFGGEPGKYTVRFRAAHYPDAEERFHYVELSEGTGKERTYIGWRKVTGTIDDPQVLEFEVDHHPGERQQLWLHQRTHQDRADKNLWTIHRSENGIGTLPGVWIDWAEVTGPKIGADEASVANPILGDRPDGISDDQYARDVIAQFATKAFRGTEAEPSYLEMLYERYQDGRTENKTMTDALISSLSIVLSSPQFLYMVEASEDVDSERLSDTELAVRMAYLLWSDAPDKELLQLASENRLSDPATLREQTERLLADPRHKRFVHDFTHQWLDMQRLGMFQFDGVLNRTFDNAARENARDEVFETVEYIANHSLPLGTLLNSEFVIINDVMAGYYGIEGVEGHKFRRVDVSQDSPRGGLLGTAAVMAMGSDGLRSSPVERGAWVLRHLLHDPPAPAPPNVPQLSRLADAVFSARELQRAHQEQPQCAQCHQKIDPIGYGLENFAADGLWREKEVLGTGRRKFGEYVNSHEFDIDPSGRLPNGKSFSNYFELRELVAAHEDEFARGFTEALIAYGLGRPYGFSDQSLADRIVAAAKAERYPVRAFIHGLVQSEVFQSR